MLNSVMNSSACYQSYLSFTALLFISNPTNRHDVHHNVLSIAYDQVCAGCFFILHTVMPVKTSTVGLLHSVHFDMSCRKKTGFINKVNNGCVMFKCL